MSTQHRGKRIVGDECATRLSRSDHHEWVLDLRRQLVHCRALIDEALSRIVERPSALRVDEDDTYQFGPQGAD